MIMDTLNSCLLSIKDMPYITRGLKILKDPKIADLDFGRHEMEDGYRLDIHSYVTEDARHRRVESHLSFIDIQCVLSGEEYVDWFPARDLTVSHSYDKGKDVVFYTSPAADAPARFKLVAGMVAVFFVSDAHRPGIIVNQPCQVRKAVLKVPVLPHKER